MENIQLKTIIEYLETQDEKLNKLLENSTNFKGSSEVITLNKIAIFSSSIISVRVGPALTWQWTQL